jgi:hypothetical protein
MALLFREAHQWERTWIWATDEEDDVLRPPADDAERMVAPRITFARHSLVEGGSFNEFQLIICRKGMMNGCSDASAKRAFSVMHASLCRFGILALAQGETLRHHPHALDYGRLAMDAELHRRMR